MKTLSVTLTSGQTMLINELQVVSVARDLNVAIVRMSNGDELAVVSPSYEQWENDEFIRRD